MGTPFLGEVKIVSFNFPPKGWAFCNGQFLPINQNQALFSILGTMYGGNGQTTFALPDLRGRAPVHRGSLTVGQAGGQEASTLTISQMPAHIHVLSASSNSTGGTITAGGQVFGNAGSQVYSGPQQLTSMNPADVTSVGGSQPHSNMQPYSVLNFIIALQGVFPSQN